MDATSLEPEAKTFEQLSKDLDLAERALAVRLGITTNVRLELLKQDRDGSLEPESGGIPSDVARWRDAYRAYLMPQLAADPFIFGTGDDSSGYVALAGEWDGEYCDLEPHPDGGLYIVLEEGEEDVEGTEVLLTVASASALVLKLIPLILNPDPDLAGSYFPVKLHGHYKFAMAF